MNDKKRLSFEFYPPKTEVGFKKLKTVRETLNQSNPDFFSCTYGAGGSTRDNTMAVIKAMRDEGFDIAPHLSFGGDSEDGILSLLNSYKELGVKRLVCLRGDIPSGVGIQRLVYAKDLVEFVKKHCGDQFEMEVAAYPEMHPDAPSYDADVQFLKEKLDVGASSAITQYFYNIESYKYFLDACDKAGIEKPIYPGIMPLTNYENLARFSKKCGADIPRWLAYKLQSFGDDKSSLIDFGVEFMTDVCEQLLALGAPGIHFYTMNKIEPNQRLVKNFQHYFQ